MQIVQYGEKYSVPCVLLLGYFDGMHVGHRALVAKAKQVVQKLGLDKLVEYQQALRGHHDVHPIQKGRADLSV